MKRVYDNPDASGLSYIWDFSTFIILKLYICTKHQKIMQKISKDFVGASATSVILSILKHGDSYGYEMILKVKEFTNGQVEWHEVGIYPVLKKLENEGMIKSYWKVLDGERPRKYYTLQEEGMKQLESNKYEWNLVEILYKKHWSLG
jgi:PadR family transcriptional regulator, regulatory protein PadR